VQAILEGSKLNEIKSKNEEIFASKDYREERLNLVLMCHPSNTNLPSLSYSFLDLTNLYKLKAKLQRNPINSLREFICSSFLGLWITMQYL